MTAAWLPKWMKHSSSSSSNSLRPPWRASSYNVCLRGGDGMGSTTNQRKSSPLVGGKPAPTTSHHTPLLPWKLCSWPAPPPSLWGSTLWTDRTIWGSYLGFVTRRGRVGFFFLTLYFGCTYVFNPGAQGRQRRTEVINFAPFLCLFFL